MSPERIQGAPAPQCDTCGAVAAHPCHDVSASTRSTMWSYHDFVPPSVPRDDTPPALNSFAPSQRIDGTRTSVEELEAKMAAIPDDVLVGLSRQIVSNTCNGLDWRMSIPVRPQDDDMVICEIVRRFVEARRDSERPNLNEEEREALDDAVGVLSMIAITTTMPPDRTAAFDKTTRVLRALMLSARPEEKGDAI